MESATFSGQVRDEARATRTLTVVEGRIASGPDDQGRVRAIVRRLTGDNQQLGPFLGADPIAVIEGGDVTGWQIPARNDPCWIAVDEGGAPACIVAWGPRA